MLDPDEIENRTIVKEKKHLLAMKQKQNEVNEARALAKKGVPIEEIAKTMHHTCKTIQKDIYLQIILLKMDIIMLVFQESLHHMKLK